MIVPHYTRNRCFLEIQYLWAADRIWIMDLSKYNWIGSAFICYRLIVFSSTLSSAKITYRCRNKYCQVQDSFLIYSESHLAIYNPQVLYAIIGTVPT